MRWENEMEQNDTRRDASNILTAALKRTKQQIDYEQNVILDRKTKAKESKFLQTREKAASKIKQQ